MTEKPEASVLTARRAAQHFRLSSADDACEHLYILIVRSSLRWSGPKCWQIHRCLTVSAPVLRMRWRAHANSIYESRLARMKMLTWTQMGPSSSMIAPDFLHSL